MLDRSTTITLPAGAFEAITATRHDVFGTLHIAYEKAAHGGRYRVSGSRAELSIVRTLLLQVGSGAWPCVSEYGRLACRRVMKRKEHR